MVVGCVVVLGGRVFVVMVFIFMEVLVRVRVVVIVSRWCGGNGCGVIVMMVVCWWKGFVKLVEMLYGW